MKAMDVPESKTTTTGHSNEQQENELEHRVSHQPFKIPASALLCKVAHHLSLPEGTAFAAETQALGDIVVELLYCSH